MKPQHRKMDYSKYITVCWIVIWGCAIIGATAVLCNNWLTKQVAAQSAAKLATAGSLTILSSDAGQWPRLEIGNSGTVMEYVGPADAPFMSIGENDLLIEKINGTVMLSIRLMDCYGKFVGELVRNEWKVNQAHYFDRNFNSDTIEIRDLDGDVVFQLRVLPDRVQLQGVFYSANGGGCILRNKNSWDGNGKISRSVIGVLQAGRKPLGKIRPLFKYPSELHLGELDDPNRPIQLTDGRTKTGKMISGKPTRIIKLASELYERIDAKDWPAALNISERYVEMVDEATSDEIESTGELYIGNDRLREVFSLAAFCAHKMEKYDLALRWAKVALSAGGGPAERGMLVAILISALNFSEAEVVILDGLAKGEPYAAEFRDFLLKRILPKSPHESAAMMELYKKTGVVQK